MKLLYITPRISGAGGMQRVLSVKTALLAGMGYTVAVLTTNADSEDVIYDFHPSINFYNITPDRGTAYLWSYKSLLNEVVAKINPDVAIMCDNGLKGFLLPFILKANCTLVYERHGSKYIEEKPVKKSIITLLKNKAIYFYMEYAAARFDKFIVLTPAATKEWKLKNIEVIPNPLWFTPVASAALTSNTAIAVGRHTYEKGFDRLLEIWSRIIKVRPDWVLNIYGDDNPEFDLKKKAKALGISSQVNFSEPQKDILDAYIDASVCLMTSRSEGFGMVLIEAMACGVPCIAFDCPVGPSDIITDGYNGFLIRDGNIAAYVSKLETLMENEVLRKEMGCNAITSTAKFESSRIMEKWDILFRSLS